MEYREAVRRGVDVRAFLYDGEGAWPPQDHELDRDGELKRWRAELMEHRCVRTSEHDPASIETQVRDPIARWLQNQRWPEVHDVWPALGTLIRRCPLVPDN